MNDQLTIQQTKDLINNDTIKSGSIVMATTTSGKQFIGRITNINKQVKSILFNDMVLVSDLTKLQGKWGGIVLGFSSINQLIKT